MCTNIQELLSTIVTNDVFEELQEENERLIRELIFANELFKVLLEMKYNLRSKLNCNDERYYRVLPKSDIARFFVLEREFKRLCLKHQVEEKIISDRQNKANVDKKVSIELHAVDDEEEHRSISEITEEDEPQDSEEESVRQPDQQQCNLFNKQIDDQGDEQLEERDNEQQDEHQGDSQDEQTTVVDGDTRGLVDEPMVEENDRPLNRGDDQQFHLNGKQIPDHDYGQLAEQIITEREEQSDEPNATIDVNETQNINQEKSEDYEVIIIKEVFNNKAVEY